MTIRYNAFPSRQICETYFRTRLKYITPTSKSLYKRNLCRGLVKGVKFYFVQTGRKSACASREISVQVLLESTILERVGREIRGQKAGRIVYNFGYSCTVFAYASLVKASLYYLNLYARKFSLDTLLYSSPSENMEIWSSSLATWTRGSVGFPVWRVFRGGGY